MTDFPAHYSETAIAVLSLPGWTQYVCSETGKDCWEHDNGTDAIVNADGTIDTYPPVSLGNYMTADPIFRD